MDPTESAHHRKSTQPVGEDQGKGKGGRNRMIRDSMYCGGSHPKGRCPAYGKTCSKCQRQNHLSEECLAGSIAKRAASVIKRKTKMIPKHKVHKVEENPSSDENIYTLVAVKGHHHYVPSTVNRSAVMDLHRSRSCATLMQSLYDICCPFLDVIRPHCSRSPPSSSTVYPSLHQQSLYLISSYYMSKILTFPFFGSI